MEGFLVDVEGTKEGYNLFFWVLYKVLLSPVPAVLIVSRKYCNILCSLP